MGDKRVHWSQKLYKGYFVEPSLEDVYYNKWGAFTFLRTLWSQGKIPIKMIESGYETNLYSRNYEKANKVKSNKLNLKLYKNVILLDKEGWLYVKS